MSTIKDIITRYLSTQEVAERLGYTVQHTRVLIRQGKLAAHKFGRDWIVAHESMAAYQATLPLVKIEPPKIVDAAHIVNVASVPMRSPFRYPGGKTWLVPRIRQWLQSAAKPYRELVEPFAGGAIVGLTAAFENLVGRVTLAEIDEDVAAVWETILNGGAERLADRIASFELTMHNIRRALTESAASVEGQAFATILRNRINRGGILAPGAGIVKNGENGRGLMSRWYPQTLRRRILDIAAHRDRIRFVRRDGIRLLEEMAGCRRVAFFIDPPYTVAGRRLYKHSDVDHERVFEIASRLTGDFLMTYDDAEEIRALAHRHRLASARVPMKNTHHEKKWELLIGRDLGWLERMSG